MTPAQAACRVAGARPYHRSCRSVLLSYRSPYCDTSAAPRHDTNHCIATYSRLGHARARAAACPAWGRPCRRLYPSLADRVAPPVARPSTHRLAIDECKTHLCFEFISHVILRILYPSSCKTHNISSKLGFKGLLMKSK